MSDKSRLRIEAILLMSLRLLAAHRLRTALSVSGLLAGVATLMVMVAVGAGAERRVLERVRAMGTDLVVVSAAPAARVAGRRRQVEVQTSLRPADAAAIAEESPYAAGAAASVSRPVVVRRQGLNARSVLTGTTVDGLRIRSIRVAAGRSFDDGEDRERRRVALLGPSLARHLFAGADPVGQQVVVDRVPFEVIGVLRRRGTDVGGTDLDNAIVIPLETAMRRVLNVPYVHALFAQARGSGELEALERDLRAILERRHPGTAAAGAPWVIQNQAVLLRTERGAARALRRNTVVVAALALLVGGVGILAVMLISVRERVVEIGLRRAVGARARDIQLQFLLESALLAGAGGAAGVLTGTIAALAAAALGPWDLVISWPAAALGLACSTALGLALGWVPATRAARLNPIDALRIEA